MHEVGEDTHSVSGQGAGPGLFYIIVEKWLVVIKGGSWWYHQERGAEEASELELPGFQEFGSWEEPSLSLSPRSRRRATHWKPWISAFWKSVFSSQFHLHQTNSPALLLSSVFFFSCRSTSTSSNSSLVYKPARLRFVKLNQNIFKYWDGNAVYSLVVLDGGLLG